jgi:hypothetical protein
MVRRVNKIGVSWPNVATQGTDEIVIQLAGIHDPAKAAAIIGSTGQLQFYDFEKDLAAPTVNQLTPTPYPTAYSLLKQIEGQVKVAGVPSSYYLFGPKTVTKTVNGKTTKTTTKHAILQTALTRNQLLGPYGGKKPAGILYQEGIAKMAAFSRACEADGKAVANNVTGTCSSTRRSRRTDLPRSPARSSTSRRSRPTSGRTVSPRSNSVSRATAGISSRTSPRPSTTAACSKPASTEARGR